MFLWTFKINIYFMPMYIYIYIYWIFLYEKFCLILLKPCVECIKSVYNVQSKRIRYCLTASLREYLIFFLSLHFLWKGDSKERNKDIKFSKINDQNLVIKTGGTGSGMFLLWLIYVKLTMIKSWFLYPVFILSSLPACRI